MKRRDFVLGMCAGGLATLAAPMVSFARVPGNGRLVFVLLRGGFDGLAAVVPYGDPGYRSLRGAMAYDPSDLLELDRGFGLAPGLSPLSELWTAGELAVVHAMAIPYRTRSHFDGQAILESGLERPEGASDGWLNRLLQVMDGERAGLAVAAGLPRSLSGEFPVATWSPVELGVLDDGYLERLHVLYRADRGLYDRFEAGLQMRELASDEDTASDMRGRGRQGRIAPVMRAAARFVSRPGGPNVAAVEFGGWDTHANQGMAGGNLDRLLGQLADGIMAYRKEAGASWVDTTMVVMTEFGRTARPNGTGGTDHGTAGAGFVIGPSLSRSGVVTDWPGLGDRSLFEGRDLKPTLDTRAVLKGVIAGVFDLTAAQTGRVFPGSDGVRPVYDLIV